MILEINIKDFAIIDNLELRFNPGLVILTGETGAGKSIIIDAVETLLGSQTDSTMVRAGAEKAIVEATFKINSQVQPSVHTILVDQDLLDEPDYLTMTREIRNTGRSTSRINGRLSNMDTIRRLGELLIDVHGQSEHLSLLRVNQHLDLLDRFGSIGGLRSQYEGVYKQLQTIHRELSELKQAERESVRLIDILNYQINEIQTANLKPDEEEDLREEQVRLANAEGLAVLAQEALQLLDENDPETSTATDLVGQSLRAITGLARLDSSQTIMVEQIQEISENLNELTINLRDYIENIEFNPKRLDRVEDRLNLIHTLKRKYSTNSSPTIKDVLQFASQAQLQLDTITNAGERIEELETAAAGLLRNLAAYGQELSKERHLAAEKLSSELESELNYLHMEQAKFQVDFRTHPDPNGVTLDDGQRVRYDSTGLEKIEFLVAPNPGEGFKPLVKIASGGETSRLMLAIKNVLARADRVPTLIFDEIDQGIGGRVGTIVGEKLWRLAQNHQVLCVTHLPQLAAFGEQHLLVAKDISDGRTTTQVISLENEARLDELALMMGSVSKTTKHSAAELLQSVSKITQMDRPGT